uniref:Uncharacterized protein n=1 Tax=Anguilla anguilla TaxID=7936 RepID=A0A0E9Q632_ANGAN
MQHNDKLNLKCNIWKMFFHETLIHKVPL